MGEWLSLVRESPPFYSINDDEFYTLLRCCALEQMLYGDGEYIFRMGESVSKVLVLLRGKARVIQENFWGHQEHIYHIREGELFGRSYSCAGIPVLSVSVVAEGGCETLSLNYQRMITFCPPTCDPHARFMHNMLRLVSEHGVKLENKLEYMCRRAIREKLLSYSSKQAMTRGGRDLDIPHNHRESVEYLCVDRSAMSSELSKIRAERILDFRKNHFMLYDRGMRDRGEGA